MVLEHPESESVEAQGDREVVRIPRPDESPPATVQQRADEMFCHSCGRVIKREAAMCVGCGVPTATGRTRTGTGTVRYKGGRTGLGEGKNRTTSVLLAIFLGFWTWLYTYREDSTKFWLTIGLSIVNVVLGVLTLGIWLLISIPASIGFWIWAIVDVVSKKDEWYAEY